ncbi:pimeloyl-ACP methyl ester esterase BioH [Thiocystis violascens]|uniref:Pimeloyl-[acyl-carrier protein] methyl ester esterase n=1 Tax=Thiocystis violascens (strain ATCC 17096 / DSM 198 / 6111) TaxID=765911 RepID=I3Y9S0_THIV6|nr:pimeloyl-ACP methyl ester esterase BioH [Thiocystis violascens]AFL73738.1 carboxylesterase BioH (pimeloyl-CoA synthesis) [Thiocystis violascens DSM 198]
MPINLPTAHQDLVMLHGWGMNAAVWDACPADTWNGLNQHRIELPGHGHSPFPPALDSLWSWADACLDAAPEQAVWLGWSLGGLVALAAALRAPKRVAGLVLLTATPRFVRAADWTPAMPETTLDQFHQELAADPAATLARFLALQVRGSDSAREVLRTLREALASQPAPNPAALSLGLDLLRDEDLRGRLPDLRCPALWLFGDHDALVPAKVAERIEILMPGARTQLIAGAAHAPHLSHPVETARAIRSFLAEPAA